MSPAASLDGASNLCYRWYDLSVLYSEAVRMGVAVPEIEATKSMVEDAWDAYVETISPLVLRPERTEEGVTRDGD